MALPKRSKAEVCEVARNFKRKCAAAGLLNDNGSIDLKRVFEDLSTVAPGWSFEPVERDEMRKGYVGLTQPERKVIQLLNGVYEGLCRDEEEHCFTGAHELGHMLMHDDVELARTEPIADSVSLSAELEEEADEFARQLLGYDSPAQEHACREAWRIISRFMTKPIKLGKKEKGLRSGEAPRRPWDGE